MRNNQKDSNKIDYKKTKGFPKNGKRKSQYNAKPKPQPQLQRKNKAAEIIRQKKQAEKAEKERKIMEFKKKRLEKSKVISKKTSRGQPLMKNRIEYLLQQIQEMKKH